MGRGVYVENLKKNFERVRSRKYDSARLSQEVAQSSVACFDDEMRQKNQVFWQTVSS